MRQKKINTSKYDSPRRFLLVVQVTNAEELEGDLTQQLEGLPFLGSLVLMEATYLRPFLQQIKV